MTDKTVAELQAERNATSNVVAFQARLDMGTDEFRNKILTALLANELEDIKGYPLL